MDRQDIKILGGYETQDNDLVIRRYMSVSKLHDLIKNNALYFAPASYFDDQFEGHYSNLDYRNWDTQLAKWRFSKKQKRIASDAKANVAIHNKKTVVISCWTKSNKETMRMWTEYGKSEEAIAIETTIGTMKTMIGPDYLFIPVRYIDFKKNTIPKGHSLIPYFYKSHSYAWEKEIRIVGEMELGKRIGSPKRVPICLKALFKNIVCSPLASAEFFETVCSLIKNVAPKATVAMSKIKI
jgi:hypothetical protein